MVGDRKNNVGGVRLWHVTEVSIGLFSSCGTFFGEGFVKLSLVLSGRVREVDGRGRSVYFVLVVHKLVLPVLDVGVLFGTFRIIFSAMDCIVDPPPMILDGALCYA